MRLALSPTTSTLRPKSTESANASSAQTWRIWAISREGIAPRDAPTKKKRRYDAVTEPQARTLLDLQTNVRAETGDYPQGGSRIAYLGKPIGFRELVREVESHLGLFAASA